MIATTKRVGNIVTHKNEEMIITDIFYRTDNVWIINKENITLVIDHKQCEELEICEKPKTLEIRPYSIYERTICDYSNGNIMYENCRKCRKFLSFKNNGEKNIMICKKDYIPDELIEF